MMKKLRSKDFVFYQRYDSPSMRRVYIGLEHVATLRKIRRDMGKGKESIWAMELPSGERVTGSEKKKLSDAKKFCIDYLKGIAT